MIIWIYVQKWNCYRRLCRCCCCFSIQMKYPYDDDSIYFSMCLLCVSANTLLIYPNHFVCCHHHLSISCGPKFNLPAGKWLFKRTNVCRLHTHTMYKMDTLTHTLHSKHAGGFWVVIKYKKFIILLSCLHFNNVIGQLIFFLMVYEYVCEYNVHVKIDTGLDRWGRIYRPACIIAGWIEYSYAKYTCNLCPIE